jgi:hypothetical protein
MSVEGGETRALLLLSTFVHQCSAQYSSQVCHVAAPGGAVYSVYTDAGDTCLVRAIVPPAPLPAFDAYALVAADGDGGADPALRALTAELRAITERATDCRFARFEVRWGVRDGAPPFLLDGPAGGVGRGAALELLCLALEITVQPEPGRCITPDRACVGADHTVQRKKVAIFRIRRFFNRALDGDDLDAAIQRVVARFGALYPDSALASVPCCPHCFKLYSTTSAMSAAAAPIVPLQRPVRPLTLSVQRRVFPQKMRHFVAFQQMPSGLTIVQDVSAGSHRSAYHIYSSDPFPAFRQHA